MTDKEEREVLRRYLRQYLSAKRRSQGSVYETRAIDALRTYAKVRSMVGLGERGE